MTFLAPWALAIAAVAAAGVVLLHLVAHQRPAAYVLPTTRFIPDQRTLVSRAATRPRDLLLLALRVLLLLAAGAAFARPVLTPARGALARVILLDRSRAVADPAAAVSKVRALTSDGVPTSIIAFDSTPALIVPAALDSISRAQGARANGSLSAAFVAARRAGSVLAQQADSVQLVLVSPVSASEVDSATVRLRGEWPGALRVERVAARADTAVAWRLERALPAQDPLGPSVTGARAVPTAAVTRLVRATPSAADSAFARGGGTVVRWDSTSANHPAAEGLSAADEVIVAPIGRRTVGSGSVRARWADGAPAAVESKLGSGCLRDVGIQLPASGDLPLHASFQRIARLLLTPCGVTAPDRAADSAFVARLVGQARASAPAALMRALDARTSPLARWLLALAILLALAELAVRARGTGEPA